MRSWSKWSSPLRAGMFAAALSPLLPCFPAAAWAQGADAGSAPAEPGEPQGNEEARNETQDPHAGGAAAEQPPPPGLKTLSPSQRLPENLQGWMRERQRRNPALMERRATSSPPQPALAPQLADDDPTVDVLKRRLRSFDEGGVTVLSNRRGPPEPVAPAVTRVAAAAAVARPAPVAAPASDPSTAPPSPAEEEAELDEPDTDDEPSVAARSLRPRSSAARPAEEDATPQWPAWLAVTAAFGLAVVWLRKRRAVSQSS